MRVLITGSAGFIGKHLSGALHHRGDLQVTGFDVQDPPQILEQALAEADCVFHLAGVNRPHSIVEFQAGNADFTANLCRRLAEAGRRPLVVFSSSIQAALDNPYGASKKAAEETLQAFARDTGARVVIFRLENVFGKWCRPNYNSVVATFCHNIAHDLPITISDPTTALELVYIDDVIAAFLEVLDEKHAPPTQAPTEGFRTIPRSFTVTLGDLATRIRAFKEGRETLSLMGFDQQLTKCLYATYLSYLDSDDFAYGLTVKTDHRGSLAEFLKAPQLGQIFVSRTRPGITRGNHYHLTKTEKFLVIEGEAVIRLRQVFASEIIEYRVSGKDYRVVDIPPGYTHSLENVGQTDLTVLFWASEVFDPAHPDTFPLEVGR